MQEYFSELVDHATDALRGDEVLLVNLHAEDSDFVRLNRSAIRQAGGVQQAYLTLELIDGQKHCSQTLTLTRQPKEDRGRVSGALESLRTSLADVPEDPHLLYATDVHSTEHLGENALPDPAEALDAVLLAGAGLDMVGIFAAGGVQRGFGNSLGQRNWFSTHTFHLEWSFYHTADKAVKTSWAGFEWDPVGFQGKVDDAVEQLDVLRREPRTISPGEYRVYLAPAAVGEILGLLCWGGFGLKDHRTKFTPLLRMIESDARLDETVTLRENTAGGMAPGFNAAGFVKPDAVTLIDAGRYGDCLVSPRSSKEYGVPCNGADSHESPRSLDLQPGGIDAADVVGKLGEGVLINQLWYGNFSDRPAGRMTGMTRFATFWVEDGRIAAPLNVMRFDETIYRMLGENLIGLTRQRDFLPESHTYDARSVDSMHLPGALIDGFRFTL